MAFLGWFDGELSPDAWFDAELQAAAWWDTEIVQYGGGGPAGQTLSPSLYTNAQSFFAPTVAPGAVTLTPALHTNAQTFFAPTVAPGAVTIAPALHTNAQTFYAPTVTPGAVTLTPAPHTNTQTFYAPTVAPGPVTLAPALHTNAQTFYAPTVSNAGLSLSPPLLVNTSQFFSNDSFALQQGASLGGFANNGTTTVSTPYGDARHYERASQQYLSQSISTLAASSPITFAVLVSFDSDADECLISIGNGGLDRCAIYKYASGGIALWTGVEILTPTATSNNTWYTVVGRMDPGGVRDIWINGVQEASTASMPYSFGAMTTIALGAYYVNGAIIHALDLDGAMPVAAVYDRVWSNAEIADFTANPMAFFRPSVVSGAPVLQPPLLANTQTFYAATVTPDAVTITSPLLSNAQTFYAPTVTPGAVTIAPPLHTNTQQFYAPTVIASNTITAPLLSNAQTFYAATVTPGTVTITPPLLVNAQAFYSPLVSRTHTITDAQANLLYQIYLLHGLEPGTPLVVGPTQRQAGGVAQSISDSAGTITITTTAAPPAPMGEAGDFIDALAALHGLSASLVVTPSARSAGAVSQSIAEAAGITTVTRL